MANYRYYVYILTNKHHTTFYVGVTNNIYRRIEEHRNSKHHGFTRQYALHKLVYFEKHKYIDNAIRREKLLKRWKREHKQKLITKHNPEWLDLC